MEPINDIEKSARMHLMHLKRRVGKKEFSAGLYKRMEAAYSSGDLKRVISVGLCATMRAKTTRNINQQLNDAINSENVDIDVIENLLDKISWW